MAMGQCNSNADDAGEAVANFVAMVAQQAAEFMAQHPGVVVKQNKIRTITTDTNLEVWFHAVISFSGEPESDGGNDDDGRDWQRD